MSQSIELPRFNPEPPQSGPVETRDPFARNQEDRASRRIFLMTDSFQTGGSERQFVMLAGAVDRSRYDVHLGCLQLKGPLGTNLGTVEHFDLGGSLYRLHSMRARYRLARRLRRGEIQIAHAFDYYTNLVLIPAAKLAGTRVIIGSQRQLGDLLSPAQRRAQATMFRWADCVVCNSRVAADRLVDQGLSADKVRVIGNGLPKSAFIAIDRGSHPKNSFRVGMIARMNTKAKNHRFLLKVAARIQGRIPDFELILVGDGPLRAELERYTEELGVRNAVQFLGDRRDIPDLLESMDVTVLPSSSESLSNAILESMAAGVPVIANHVGGNAELIGDDRGILVGPGSEEGLESALLRLAHDSGLRFDMGRNARRFAQENFTLEQMWKRYDELYSELLERKGTGSKAVTARTRPAAAPLRISIVGPSLSYVGGQSVQADLLLKHWQDDPGVDAKLILIDPRFPRGLKWVERVPGLRTLLRQPFYLASLWRGLKKADVAHIFSASYWSFLLAPVPAWFVARVRGKKILLHYHSGEARDHLQRFRSARFFIRKMDSLIVPSGYLKDVFAEFGLRAEAIPNIVDLSQFRFRERKPLRPHLICTRGFHPYYRVDLVVQAFAEVQKAFPEATLDLAGVGPLEWQIRELVQKSGLSGVNFLGAVSRNEIGRIYDQADIFVNASSLDNMPVSVIEAFACGTPVVSTAPDGMDYLVEHERTGLLSPIGDAGALARNILRLLRDSQLSTKLIANAYEDSFRFRWAGVRDSWMNAYQALLHGTRCQGEGKHL